MKKTIITAVAFLVLFGFAITGAMAQTWTWQYAPVTAPSGITELTANPTTDALYGLSGGSAVPISTGTPVTTGNPFTTPGDLSNFSDIAVGFQGAVYAITDTAVASCTPTCTAFVDQPIVPTETGVFKHIAAGKNGKLFVLYEDGANQYILTGNPPVGEALLVKLNPQSLNLGSKGNWVTCLIQIPGYDIQGIDPSSIVITQFEIDGKTYDVNIPVDGNAPHAFTNDGKLMVKFVRYNKTTPNDPESLVGVLSDLLPAGPSHGKVPVTAIVQATHTDGTFSGEVTFQVIVPKAKKGKK
jgi:hypothetical protein